MRRRWRPDSNLARLTPDAYALACAMVESRDPVFTAEQICAAVAQQHDQTINRNNVTTLRRELAQQSIDRDEKAMGRAVWAQQIGAKLGLDDDGTSWLRDMMTASVMANETDLTTISPEKLARVIIADRRTDLLEQKLAQDKQRLKLDRRKLELDIEKLQRDLDRERAEAQRKADAAAAAIAQADTAGGAIPADAVNVLKKELGLT